MRRESASSSLVIDASAAVDFLLSRGDEGDWVAAVVAGSDALVAPHLIDFEVASAMRSLTLGGAIAARRGAQALDDFARMRMFRVAGGQLLQRMWEMRGQLDVFDAAYVALAERLQLPLITTDRRLARTRGHRAEVIAFPA